MKRRYFYEISIDKLEELDKDTEKYYIEVTDRPGQFGIELPMDDSANGTVISTKFIVERTI